MMHRKLLQAAVQYSLDTGAVVKFDLKAFDEGFAHCADGRLEPATLENFTPGCTAIWRSAPTCRWLLPAHSWCRGMWKRMK